VQLKKINITKIAKRLVIAYVVIGVALYFLQTLFLFHPQKVDKNYKYNFKDAYTENFISAQGDSIHLVKFSALTLPTKGLLIYYHGNMKNVGHYGNFVNIFTKNGYEVWMPDYPSFGKSTGNITEPKLFALADTILKNARLAFADSNIILYGKSFGTGLASYSAQQLPCKALVLETPYKSIPSLFSSYAPIYPCSFLAKYNLPNFKYIQQAKAPVTIFHGTKDGVIPYRNAVQLKKNLKLADSFITVEGADHKNINTTQQYLTVMEKILK
jgi:uncharacterized protein